MMIHVADMIKDDVTCITVRSAHTDVLVILISFMPKFLVMSDKLKLWLDFGVANSIKLISINDCHENLGNARCLGTFICIHYYFLHLNSMQFIGISFHLSLSFIAICSCY